MDYRQQCLSDIEAAHRALGLTDAYTGIIRDDSIEANLQIEAAEETPRFAPPPYRIPCRPTQRSPPPPSTISDTSSSCTSTSTYTDDSDIAAMHDVLRQPTKAAQIQYYLDLIKPINLTHYIMELVEAETVSKRLHIIGCFLELFGFIWRSDMELFEISKQLLLTGFTSLSKTITEFKNDARFNRFHTENSPDLTDESLDSELLTQERLKVRYNSKAQDVKITNESFGEAIEINGSLLNDFFKRIGKTLPAHSEHIAPLLQVLTPLLYAGFSSLGITAPGKKVCGVIGNIAKSMKDSSTICKSMQDVYNGVTNAMKATFDPESADPRAVFQKKLREFDTDLYAFEKRLSEKQAAMLHEPELFNELDKKHDEIVEFYEIFAVDKENVAGFIATYSGLNTRFFTVRTEWDRIELSSRKRQEPTCIWLSGDPGVGKSRFIFTLCELLSQAEGKKLSYYNRNGNDQYWTGYKDRISSFTMTSHLVHKKISQISFN